MIKLLMALMLMGMLFFCSGCTAKSELVEKEKVLTSEPIERILNEDNTADDCPSVPDEIPEGTEELYDFCFSEKYDAHVTDDFSLVIMERMDSSYKKFVLFDKFEKEQEPIKEYLYDGDGMVPYQQKKYWYNVQDGDFLIGTDYYELDDVEYISYLCTDATDITTNRNIGVGSTENDILSAYTENLYYLDKEEALSETGLFMLAWEYEGEEEVFSDKFSFDAAYLWQPFTPETNEIRDITFYLKDEKVIAVEMIKPFELRHVYGYDRIAGLEFSNEKRKKTE